MADCKQSQPNLRNKFLFICVHAPTSPEKRLGFLDKLCQTLEICNNEEYLFVCGDFNCTLENNDHNHKEPHMSSRKWLIVEKHELIDVWRSFH